MKFETPENDKVSDLLRIAQGLGVLKQVKQGVFTNFKLAYHPFTSTRQYYEYMGLLHTTWQKVLLNVAKDYQFIIDIFTPLAQRDDMLKGILNILKKKGPKFSKEGIVFDRIDYYNDESEQPKLTEFNLFSVGMQSNMERFQQAKRICENDNTYFKSPTVKNFALALREIANLNKRQDAILFVTTKNQANLMDQARFEIEMRKQSLKVIRTNLKEMTEKLVLHENGDLYFGKERVSFVYYRSTYRLDHFEFGENYDINKSWEALEKVELSNAIPIPSIEFRLVNLKRVQTELGKLEVLRKYATEEEAEMLMKTRVQEWEFDSMSEGELKTLTAQVQQNPRNYMLKPNMQGGGNNIFDGQMIIKLREANLQVLRSSILMERIKTKSVRNLIINGQISENQDCEYELSRYGTLSWFNGQIIRNTAEGFLIRAKPPTANEGGIMTGIGAIVPWKFI